MQKNFFSIHVLFIFITINVCVYGFVCSVFYKENFIMPTHILPHQFDIIRLSYCRYHHRCRTFKKLLSKHCLALLVRLKWAIQCATKDSVLPDENNVVSATAAGQSRPLIRLPAQGPAVGGNSTWPEASQCHGADASLRCEGGLPRRGHWVPLWLAQLLLLPKDVQASRDGLKVRSMQQLVILTETPFNHGSIPVWPVDKKSRRFCHGLIQCMTRSSKVITQEIVFAFQGWQ